MKYRLLESKKILNVIFHFRAPSMHMLACMHVYIIIVIIYNNYITLHHIIIIYICSVVPVDIIMLLEFIISNGCEVCCVNANVLYLLT